MTKHTNHKNATVKPQPQTSATEYSEKTWQYLLNFSIGKSQQHKKTAALWSFLFYFLNISSLGIAAVFASDSAKNYFGENTFLLLGIFSTGMSSVSTFLNPGSKKEKHVEAARAFKNIYYHTKKCKTWESFQELQNLYEKTELEAPMLPYFFSLPIDPKKDMPVMNPLLREALLDNKI